MDVLVTDLAGQLNSARWPAILPSIIDAAERDPELASLQAGLHAGLMMPFLAVVGCAQVRRDFPSGQTPAELIASVVGPLFYRRWFFKELIDQDFATGTVARLLRPS